MGGLRPCAALCAAGLLAATAHAEGACSDWPQWRQFKQLYVSEDGRVIDAGTPQAITVSEGQAYALTFALIANDPAGFARILDWTRDNLAGGDLIGDVFRENVDAAHRVLRYMR